MSPVLVVRLSLARSKGGGGRAGGGLEAVEDFFGHLDRQINLIPSCLFATGASFSSCKIVIATYLCGPAEESLCLQASLLSKLFCLAEKGRVREGGRMRRLSKWRGGGSGITEEGGRERGGGERGNPS